VIIFLNLSIFTIGSKRTGYVITSNLLDNAIYGVKVIMKRERRYIMGDKGGKKNKSKREKQKKSKHEKDIKKKQEKQPKPAEK